MPYSGFLLRVTYFKGLPGQLWIWEAGGLQVIEVIKLKSRGWSGEGRR